MSKKLSIIIPVFNTEKYVKKCIDSIKNALKPFEENYEIIAINDGSTDESGQLIQQYATENKNIIALHQENKGISVARNNGIVRANGEYVIGVDSDDYVTQDMAGIFDELDKSKKSDLVNFGYTMVDTKGETIEKFQATNNNKLPIPYGFNAFWRTGLRKEFIMKNGLLFRPDIKAVEDQEMFIRAWLAQEKFANSYLDYYRYVWQRPGSSLATWDIEKFKGFMSFADPLMNQTKKSNVSQELKDAIHKALIGTATVSSSSEFLKSEEHEIAKKLILKSENFNLGL